MSPEDSPDGVRDPPSPSGSPDGATDASSSRLPPRTKRGPLTRNACFACRQKKVKCNGARPTCSRCEGATLACSYDSTQEGVTRLQSLREELRNRTAELGTANLIISSLQRSASDASTFDSQLLRSQTDGDSTVRNDTASQPSLTPGFSSPHASHPSASGMAPGNSDSNALVVLNALATGADAQSAAVLARIRLGEPLELVASTILQGRSVYDHFRQAPHLSSGGSGEDQDASASSNYPHSLGNASGSAWHHSSWLLPLFDRAIWLSHTDFNTPMQAATVQRPQASQALPVPADGFGNLSFSDAIWANHFPSEVQKMQAQNIFLPLWQTHCINVDAAWVDPFRDVYTGLQREMNNGVDFDYLCGPHPFLAALDEELVFRRAPPLSQIAARMTKSITNDGAPTHATQYAIMWLHWLLLRWMLRATPQSYGDMPLLVRPTPDQLFVSHPRLFDFMFSPYLRSFFCHNELLDTRFLAECCASIAFDWPGLPADALAKNRVTGEMDLVPLARARVSELQHWSVGPAVRAYLRNADFFITVR